VIDMGMSRSVWFPLAKMKYLGRVSMAGSLPGKGGNYYKEEFKPSEGVERR